MSQHTNVYDTFYLTQFDAMLAAISSWPNANHYIEKFGRLRSSLLEKGSKAFEPNTSHFNTLNHGDMFVFAFAFNSKSLSNNQIDETFIYFQLLQGGPTI